MRIVSSWLKRPGRRKTTTSNTKDINLGTPRLKLILPAGEELFQGPIPRHAQLKDLQKLGFEILNADPNGRSVRRSGRTFVEGHLESMVAGARDDMHEEIGKGRPWGTSRRREN